MTHAIMYGIPSKAQLYLEGIIDDLVAETGRAEDRYSLNRLIFKCLRDHPNRLCLIDGKTDEKLTNGEVLRSAVQTARALASRGLRAGNVAVMMAQNHKHNTALYYGALFTGITIFNFEPVLTSYEVQYYLKLTKASIAFVDSNKTEVLEKALEDMSEKPELVIFGKKITKEDIIFEEFIQGHSDDIKDYWPVPLNKDTVPLLFTTGGSTGLGPPKMTPLTNAGLIAQAPIEWLTEDNFPLCSERMLLMFHGQWLIHTAVYITGVLFGATVLVQSQDPNPGNLVDLFRNYKPTWILMTPPDAKDLITSPKYRRGDLHSLKKMVLVGVAAHPEFLSQMKMQFSPDAMLCNRYGMTECHGYVCLGDTHEPPMLSPPINLYLYKIIKDDNKLAGINEPGELYLKSDYCLAKTYYGDDEAARNMYTADGWFRTGDLVRVDEKGVFHYVDRLKFIVFNNGYPISPLEIEAVICTVPGVAAAVVVGLSNGGPAALVVPEGEEPSRDVIKQAVKEKLNPYKHLSGVCFIPALPRTCVGKIQRRKCVEIIHEMISNKQCY